MSTASFFAFTLTPEMISKLTNGCLMFMVNMGTNIILPDILPVFQRIFRNVWFRKMIIFCVFYMSIRDILLSVIMTILITLIVDFFMNEESKYCLIPLIYREKEGYQNIHQERFKNYMKNLYRQEDMVFEQKN